MAMFQEKCRVMRRWMGRRAGNEDYFLEADIGAEVACGDDKNPESLFRRLFMILFPRRSVTSEIAYSHDGQASA
jgi:hypothetical protein